jgi:hypothetical protein
MGAFFKESKLNYTYFMHANRKKRRNTLQQQFVEIFASLLNHFVMLYSGLAPGRLQDVGYLYKFQILLNVTISHFYQKGQ